MNVMLEKIISIPKSLWVCLHFFSFIEALRLPIVVKYNVKIGSLKGNVIINNTGGHKKTSLLSIGFGNVGIYDKRYSRAIMTIKGTLILNGKCALCHGSVLSIQEDATVVFGNNFINTAEGKIVCKKKIVFGNNVSTSWETLIMDTDWHSIQDTQTLTVFPDAKEIVIGSNVWIGYRCVILKGSVIPDGSIVGANTLCSKQFNEKNTVIAGNPARVCKHNVTMCRETN